MDGKRMKNLWTVSGRFVKGVFVHSAGLANSVFAPIWNGCQAVDRKEDSGVIPLRAVSCYLSTVVL